ncbi:RlpA-like double-psi beta-barrel-protein domain-containing protein-containing protein [Gongronella butleri]|nr:RlpA-like double-psi beta-barrel-protein domain-containing protein-containing protein [Gongronella butleri]
MRFTIALIALIALVFAVAEAKMTRAERKIMEKRGSSSSSSSSSSSGKSFSGTGTWFVPSTEGGSQGACGSHEADNAQVVALNSAQYGNTSKKSSWCGKTVTITYKGKTTDAVINDACPTCSYGDLDLTKTVFKDLESDFGVGELAIKWSVKN